MASAPIFTGSVNDGGVQIANADGTNDKTAWTAGASGGGVVTNITFVSTDTTARYILLKETIGGNTRVLWVFYLPAAGASGYSCVNAMDTDLYPWLDPNDPVLRVGASGVIKATMVSTLTSAKVVDVTVRGGDF